MDTLISNTRFLRVYYNWSAWHWCVLSHLRYTKIKMYLCLRARPYSNTTSLFGFCSRNKSCSSPWTASVCTSSTTIKSMSTGSQVIPWNRVAYSQNCATHRRGSLYGPYLISYGRRSPSASWSAHHVCQSKQFHPIDYDTRPGKRSPFLTPPSCRYGPAMSLQKGTLANLMFPTTSERTYST